MHSVMEDSWKEFEQTGSVRSYLKYRGMTPEQAAHVIDPFFTSRTTRKVGLGVPFFKADGSRAGGLR